MSFLCLLIVHTSITKAKQEFSSQLDTAKLTLSDLNSEEVHPIDNPHTYTLHLLETWSVFHEGV